LLRKAPFVHKLIPVALVLLVLETGVVAYPRIEPAGVDAEPLEQRVARNDRLLDDVGQNDRFGIDSQIVAKVLVGHQMDRRDVAAGQVVGNPIGFLVGKGGEDAFSGVHDWSLALMAVMNSGVVPQQPPRKFTPASTSWGTNSANSSGV